MARAPATVLYKSVSQGAYDDGTQLSRNFVNVDAAAHINGKSDNCIVPISAFFLEGFDRPALREDFFDASVGERCSEV